MHDQNCGWRRALALSLFAFAVMALTACQRSGAYEGSAQAGEGRAKFSNGAAFLKVDQRRVMVVWTDRPLQPEEKQRLLAGQSVLTALENKTPCVQLTLGFKPDAQEASLETLVWYQLICNHISTLPVTVQREHYNWKQAPEISSLQGRLLIGAKFFVALADRQTITLPGFEPTDLKWNLRASGLFEDATVPPEAPKRRN